MKFRIIIDADEDGVFVATVPSLPGCVSQGATRSEALSSVREAIEGYLESLRERGEPIPPSIHEEVIDVAVRASCRDFPGPRLSLRFASSGTKSIARRAVTSSSATESPPSAG